jgi:hypothetical protein
MQSVNNIDRLQEKSGISSSAQKNHGMISNLQLPNSEEFDVDTTLTLRKIF